MGKAYQLVRQTVRLRIDNMETYLELKPSYSEEYISPAGAITR